MIDSSNPIEISDPAALSAKPLVSVYMATYNHERYIAQAIEGVLRQHTEFPIELVIGEDCSTDNTRAIALAYQQKYPDLIRIISGPQNIGAINNSNRCLPLCNGDFIAFCEGDDYWHHPQKLQMQVQSLIDNPAAHLVHTDYDRLVGKRILRNAHQHHQTQHLAQGDDAFVSLLYCNTIIAATAMYRKQLLDDLRETGIASPAWPFGDYPKALYAAMRGPVIYLQVSTATYRHVEGSAMNQGRLKSLHMQLAGAECRERFMSLHKLPMNVEHEVRVNFHRILRHHFMLAGDMDGYKTEQAWLVSNGYFQGRLSSFAVSKVVSFPRLLKLYRPILRIRQMFDYFFYYKSAD